MKNNGRQDGRGRAAKYKKTSARLWRVSVAEAMGAAVIGGDEG